MEFFVYGFSGIVTVTIVYILLRKSKLSKKQKTLFALLALSSILVYVLWGILNLRLFEFSENLTETLVWLTVLVFPLVLTTTLALSLKQLKWPKRWVLVFLMGLIIVFSNFATLAFYIRNSIADDSVGCAMPTDGICSERPDYPTNTKDNCIYPGNDDFNDVQGARGNYCTN